MGSSDSNRNDNENTLVETSDFWNPFQLLENSSHSQSVAVLIDDVVTKVDTLTPDQFAAILEQLRIEILNIIWDEQLTKCLVWLTKLNVIKYSSNIINKFEEEREIKILDIDVSSVTSVLEGYWAEKVFEWTIEDTYYDYLDWRLDKWKEKRSFRIRKKTDKNWNEKHYFTVKKKRKEDTKTTGLRVCYEKEFEILNMSGFSDFALELIWMERTYKKVKNRTAYSLWGVKFDIDSYDWLEPLLEIEAKNEKIANNFIKLLWLEKNKTLTCWFRGLAKLKKLTYEKFR